MAGGVRESAVAGSFYPGNQAELKSMLADFFQKTKKVFPSPEKIKALVVPHAGYIFSGQTAAWGYQQLPDPQLNRGPNFVLMGPSHFSAFTGLTCSFAKFWKTPMGAIKHQPLPSRHDRNEIVSDDLPHLNEHSVEVQLPFLQFLYQDRFRFSAYLTGYPIDEKKAVKFFLKEYPSSIFIISSDLSHYLPENQARVKDQKTIEAIINKDNQYLVSEENAACGRDGLLTLIELAKKNNWQARLIFYDTSASASGDRSAVVGYSSIIFYKI